MLKNQIPTTIIVTQAQHIAFCHVNAAHLGTIVVVYVCAILGIYLQSVRHRAVANNFQVKLNHVLINEVINYRLLW